jgi:hypothetical protein
LLKTSLTGRSVRGRIKRRSILTHVVIPFSIPYMLKQTLAGLFATRSEADAAVEDLKARGVSSDNVSVVVRDSAIGRTGEDVTADDRMAATGSSAASGAAMGGLLGLLAGVAALAIPGVGALFVAGPLAASLGLTGAAATAVSGAVTGALAGGLIGALTGLGFTREDAELYENRIKEGDVMVAATLDDVAVPEQEVRAVFTKHGAEEIRTLGRSPQTV